MWRQVRRPGARGPQPRFASRETCTPKHLAEKILTPKAALDPPPKRPRRWPTRSRPTAHVRFLAGARTLVDGIPFGRAQKVGRKGRRDALRVRRGQDPLWRLNHRAGHGHLKTASCARATNAVVLPRTICSVVFLYSFASPQASRLGSLVDLQPRQGGRFKRRAHRRLPPLPPPAGSETSETPQWPCGLRPRPCRLPRR